MPLAVTTATAFLSDDDRWKALLDRNPAADGAFYFAVCTTGIYCRPGCAARLAHRKNIRFYNSCAEAQEAGYRPCKRCKPGEENLSDRHASLVAHACRIIEQAEELPGLDLLAAEVGLSAYHFHRLFKAHTGLTPKRFAAACRARRVREGLAQNKKVTDAIYDAGFNSNSRFYEQSAGMLGMTPTVFRSGGMGESIRFSVARCSLGAVLVAATERGVCAILLGDHREALTRELEAQFPNAALVPGDRGFEELVSQVLSSIETPSVSASVSASVSSSLPLDIRGTVFQQRVWEELRKIPPGETASYSEVARRIGAPQSVRAVARACGANRLAVVIPCHRVLRADGSLSGYRWGPDRKKVLLEKERCVK